MSKVIAIHQPNLFPWLGYFSKLKKADEFVFLDHVTSNPRTAIYPKRVQLIINKQDYWLTIPIKNKKDILFVPICEMEIDKPEKVADLHLKTIEQNYRKHTYFNEVMSLIEHFYKHPSPLITERNISTIKEINIKLGIKTLLHTSSKMNLQFNSTDLIIDICKKLGASTYLSGDGSGNYLKVEKFIPENISLSYMKFQHPEYEQKNNGTFYKGLSIIDCMMNIGIQKTFDII